MPIDDANDGQVFAFVPAGVRPGTVRVRLADATTATVPLDVSVLTETIGPDSYLGGGGLWLNGPQTEVAGTNSTHTQVFVHDARTLAFIRTVVPQPGSVNISAITRTFANATADRIVILDRAQSLVSIDPVTYATGLVCDVTGQRDASLMYIYTFVGDRFIFVTDVLRYFDLRTGECGPVPGNHTAQALIDAGQNLYYIFSFGQGQAVISLDPTSFGTVIEPFVGTMPVSVMTWAFFGRNSDAVFIHDRNNSIFKLRRRDASGQSTRLRIRADSPALVSVDRRWVIGGFGGNDYLFDNTRGALAREGALGETFSGRAVNGPTGTRFIAPRSVPVTARTLIRFDIEEPTP